MLLFIYSYYKILVIFPVLYNTTKPILHTLLCTSHLPYPYVAYPPLYSHWQPLISSLRR